MNSAAEIWERVLSILKQNLTETTISTWFSDIEAVSLDENQFILSVPTEFKQGILNDRYREEIQKALFELFSAEIDVVILKEQEKASTRIPRRSPGFCRERRNTPSSASWWATPTSWPTPPPWR